MSATRTRARPPARLFALASVAAITATVGCSSPRQAASNVAINAGAPIDYATKQAEVVAAHQRASEDAPNLWNDYSHAVQWVSGAWSHFEASNDAVRRIENADPNGPTPVRPRQILEDPAARHLLPELRGFLDSLDRMHVSEELDALTGDCRFVAPRRVDGLLSADHPEFGATSLFVGIWNARMRLALDDHDRDRFEHSLRQLLTVERAITGGYGLVNGMHASSTRAATSLVLRNAVMDGVLAGETAALAQRCLNGDPPAADLTVMFECDRYEKLDALDRFFENVKKGTNVPSGHGGVVDGGLGVIAPHDLQVDLTNRLHDAILTIVNEDSSAVARQEANRELDEIVTLFDDPGHRSFYQPVGQFVPALASIRVGYLTALTYDAGVRTMLALEVFRARTGRYPEQLAELGPRDIKTLPTDPYANGDSFRYRRLLAEGGGPADGYVLYTIAGDGEDNGGRVDPDHPTQPLRGAKAGSGYDYVINRRDRW